MAEYIEREALHAWLHGTMSAQNTTVGVAYVRAFWNAVLAVPTADVVPVVHGQWVRTEDGDWECTNCREAVVICVCGKDVTVKKTICPNCGARMDGE